MRESKFKSMLRWTLLLCLAFLSTPNKDLLAQEAKKDCKDCTAVTVESKTLTKTVQEPANLECKDCPGGNLLLPAAKGVALPAAPVPQSSDKPWPAGLSNPEPVQIEIPAEVIKFYEQKLQQKQDSQNEGDKPRQSGDVSTRESILGWQNLMFEGFGGFPQSNNWDVRYVSSGPYFWEDALYNPHSGSWSGWCAAGTVSPNPVLNPATANYVNNMGSWMIFGPFSLSDATDAKLDFWYWLDSELNFDYLNWAASTTLNGNYYGYRVSGNSNGYQSQSFDLKSVPTLGNLTGQSQVYIALIFQSDGSNTRKGAFLDDIYLDKFVQDQLAELVADRMYLRTGINSGDEVDNPVCGQQYYIHFNWRNTGPVTTPTFRWEVQLDGVQRCYSDLSAGANTSWVSWCIAPWTATEGSHTFRANLDIFGTVSESNENNNSVSRTWEVSCYKADLIANRVYLRTGPNSGPEVDNPVAGQQYYIHFDWRNGGPIAANNFRLDIKLNGNVICFANIATANPNTNYTTWCTSAVTWPCPASNNNVIEAVLDPHPPEPYGIVDETDETNNNISRNYPCQVTPPDLVADRMYLRTGANSGPEVDNPVAGQSYYLHFDWRNAGGESPTFRLELKLNNAVTCFYNSGTIPANSTQKSWCTSSITWPTSATPIFIEGALDVGNVISEGDENNNVVSREFRTTQPNLVPTALTFSPASVNAGGSLNLSGTVTNNGTASTGNAFNVSFYLSTSSTAPNVNLLVHTFNMPALSAGQSNNFNQTGTVPANTAPGSYYVWVRVDANNAISESNETDNQMRTATQLTVPPIGGQIRPVAGATQTIGSEFTVDIEVNNVQNLFGVSFELNFNTTYLNVVGTPTAGEFMGNDPIFFPTVDDAAGKVSIGASHKAGQTPSTGSGVVAHVRFISLNTTPNNTQVLFSLSTVSANDPSGNPITLTPSSLTVTLTGGVTVWPGDTNNDGVVNQADVLPIGLHWGRTGPARQPPSMNWIGQIVQPWTPAAAAYADATGDGTINQADVLPIGLNWSRTHTLIPAVPMAKIDPVSTAALAPEANPARALDQEFFIRMNLAQASDLFGLAFELLYDRPDRLQIISVEPDESFGSNMVFYSKVDNAAGIIAVGISRKAGQESVYGSASAVRIKAKFSANARLGETIAFSLANVSANDSNGRPIEMRAQSSRLTIGATATVADENAAQLVADYRLHQNSPNPFNPETLIRYELPDAGSVLLKVYNFTGQEVRTLVNSFQQGGSYQVIWDGRDAHGHDLPSGTYLYRLQSGSFSETRKMVLLR